MPAKTAQAGLFFEKSGCKHSVRNRFFYGRTRMAYWLMKSEPDEVSIDDVLTAPKKTVPWFGVRNYQARNFMRDNMRVGDQVFFYHSSCAEPGIAGIVEIVSGPYPDATQFDPASPYHDPKATPESPRWISVDVKAVKKTRLLSLKELRTYPELEAMRLLAKGSRLSVMPVEPAEWRFISKVL
jgi:predicted RNA-binding protein with PUA-like domain